MSVRRGNHLYNPLLKIMTIEDREPFIASRISEIARLWNDFTGHDHGQHVVESIVECVGWDLSDVKDLQAWPFVCDNCFGFTSFQKQLMSRKSQTELRMLNVVQLDVLLETTLADQGKLPYGLVAGPTLTLEVFEYLLWKRLYALTGVDASVRVVSLWAKAMQRYVVVDPTEITLAQFKSIPGAGVEFASEFNHRQALLRQ